MVEKKTAPTMKTAMVKVRSSVGCNGDGVHALTLRDVRHAPLGRIGERVRNQKGWGAGCKPAAREAS
eukprot:7145497-Prymnesium_polylepis.1